ncbi:MAG: M48 family metallopeptidase [Phycisphaerales bacterium]|nr:M48 family metallopeptidase [Phycisphaerales bacterium]
MSRAPQQAVPGAGVHREREALRALPPTVTYTDLMRANRRKSAALMAAMIALGVALGAFTGAAISAARNSGLYAYDLQADAAQPGAGAEGLATVGGELARNFGPSAALGAGAALLAACLGAAWSWFSGSSAILSMAGAREIDASDDPELFHLVDELRIAAGLPMPRVYSIDTDALNAFATGRDREHAAVAVTRGLRAELTRDELAGVMAHELAHVRHLDVRFAMLMATMVGLIVMASDIAWRMVRFAPRRRTSKEGGAAIMVVVVIALVLTLIAAPLAMLIQFAFSRQREYLADAGAVEITRYPEGLIGALQKLQNCSRPLPGANRAIAHLFIANPLKNQMHAHQNLNTAFSTHPPMQKRIERLQALMR